VDKVCRKKNNPQHQFENPIFCW